MALTMLKKRFLLLRTCSIKLSYTALISICCNFHESITFGAAYVYVAQDNAPLFNAAHTGQKVGHP